MVVGNFNELIASPISNPAAKNAFMKVLVSPENGWDGYVMRVIELDEKGYSPKHQHDWPHINYVIEGQGSLQIGDTVHDLNTGSYAYVPSGELHQFSNTGSGKFKFICIVPEEGHQ